MRNAHGPEGKRGGWTAGLQLLSASVLADCDMTTIDPSVHSSHQKFQPKRAFEDDAAAVSSPPRPSWLGEIFCIPRLESGDEAAILMGDATNRRRPFFTSLS